MQMREQVFAGKGEPRSLEYGTALIQNEVSVRDQFREFQILFNNDKRRSLELALVDERSHVQDAFPLHSLTSTTLAL